MRIGSRAVRQRPRIWRSSRPAQWLSILPPACHLQQSVAASQCWRRGTTGRWWPYHIAPMTSSCSMVTSSVCRGLPASKRKPLAEIRQGLTTSDCFLVCRFIDFDAVTREMSLFCFCNSCNRTDSNIVEFLRKQHVHSWGRGSSRVLQSCLRQHAFKIACSCSSPFFTVYGRPALPYR